MKSIKLFQRIAFLWFIFAFSLAVGAFDNELLSLEVRKYIEVGLVTSLL
jgi:hypothetical protein